MNERDDKVLVMRRVSAREQDGRIEENYISILMIGHKIVIRRKVIYY